MEEDPYTETGGSSGGSFATCHLHTTVSALNVRPLNDSVCGPCPPGRRTPLKTTSAVIPTARPTMAGTHTTNRLVQEYKQLSKQAPDPEIELVPDEDDIRRWTAFLRGPPQTPYEGFRYHLDIVVPDSYPLTPPSIKAVTKIFHPNFHFKTGEICVDIFKSEWTVRALV